MIPPLHTNQETLGERVKRLRIEREMSQEKLADFCGVTNGWISKLEKDKYSPSPELITKIASAFKIPVHELLLEEDKRMELVSRMKLIEVLLEKKHATEAEDYIHELENHPELSEKDKITLHVHLAECRYQQMRNDEVIELLQPIIDKLEAENYHDAHMMAWIRNKIGNAYIQLQDTANAYYNYKKALDYTTRFAVFDQLAAFISYNVGLTLRRKGRSFESTEYLETAAEYFMKTQDLKSYAHSLFVQGIAHKNMQNYERATTLFNQSHQIYQSLNHHALCHEVRLALASTITYHDDPAKAFSELSRCYSHFEEENDHNGMVFVLSKQANIFLELRQLDHCRSVLDHALQLVTDHSLSRTHEIGDLYTTATHYYFVVCEYEKTIHYALKASYIFATIGLITDQVQVLKWLVETYRCQNNLEKALYYQTLRSDLLETLQKE